MHIKDLPEEIQALVKSEQINQGRSGSQLSLSSDISWSSVLNWSDTTDGQEFWKSINRGRFEIFYKTYPNGFINKEKEELKQMEEDLFSFFKS